MKRTFLMSNGHHGVIAEDRYLAARFLKQEHPVYIGLHVEFQRIDNPRDFSLRDQQLYPEFWNTIREAIQNRSFFLVASAETLKEGINA